MRRSTRVRLGPAFSRPARHCFYRPARDTDHRRDQRRSGLAL